MSRTLSRRQLSRMLRSKRLLAGGALALVACQGVDTATPSKSGAKSVPIDVRLRPKLGDVVSQADPPPPISGGTLAASKTSALAVASDPDHDRVYVADLDARAVRFTVQLAPKSEPGRVALDEAGHAFVALRRAGSVATIDLATGALSTRPACLSPRGVAWDPWRSRILVACASGGVVALDPAGGAPRPFGDRIELDLRDVIVREKEVEVSTFRAARFHTLDETGKHVSGGAVLASANLAWRAMPFGEQTDLVVTQDPTDFKVSTSLGGYSSNGVNPHGQFGGFCNENVGIVSTRIWLHGPDRLDSIRIPTAVLPVDVATNRNDIVVLAAGNAHTEVLPQLYVVNAGDMDNLGRSECAETIRTGNVAQGQAVAAAFSARDELVVQTREPAQLHIMTDDRLRTFKVIDLATESRADTGHTVFHSNAGGNIACASCHAEGADDGHVWDFDDIGPRRTPSLLGTTAHTAPYHWDGDMKDLHMLADRVFTERMSGQLLTQPQVDALEKYLFTLPPPPALRAEADVQPAGKKLFEEKCAVCHSGAMKTNNMTLDVGTGGKFQVPSLVGVAWRGPWLHAGCAQTLLDRFRPDCGGTAHAEMDGIDDYAKSALVEYMESL